MKQKILIKVAMTDDKTRAKAMNTVVQFSGVTGAEIKGDHRDQIEVIGDGVDMICLTNTLRRKVAFAELVSVSKVEPPKDGDKKPEEKKSDEKKGEEKKPDPCCLPWLDGYGVPYSYSYYPCDRLCDPGHYTWEPVYNSGSNWWKM